LHDLRDQIRRRFIEGDLERLWVVLEREAHVGGHCRIEREEVQLVERREPASEQFVSVRAITRFPIIEGREQVLERQPQRRLTVLQRNIAQAGIERRLVQKEIELGCGVGVCGILGLANADGKAAPDQVLAQQPGHRPNCPS
jgi:hypothetical protein